MENHKIFVCVNGKKEEFKPISATDIPIIEKKTEKVSCSELGREMSVSFKPDGGMKKFIEQMRNELSVVDITNWPAWKIEKLVESFSIISKLVTRNAAHYRCMQMENGFACVAGDYGTLFGRPLILDRKGKIKAARVAFDREGGSTMDKDDRILEMVRRHTPLDDAVKFAEQMEEVERNIYGVFRNVPRNRLLPECMNVPVKDKPKTATEISVEMRSAVLQRKVEESTWRSLFNIPPIEKLDLGEPATENILKDIGGINMNGRGFVTPDNIDKVIVRTKDGREFEGSVKRVEYMPGFLGREGYSELTVCTIKQTSKDNYGIKEVIFNNPATIVKWDDGTRTVVYCQDNVEEVVKVVDGKEVKMRKPKKADSFNPEIGLAMAIVKKHFGNMGNYNNVFHKYIPEIQKEQEHGENTEEKAEE